MSPRHMSHRQGFRAGMVFETGDRLLRIEWATWWSQSIDRWCSESLPARDRYKPASITSRRTARTAPS